MEQLNSIKWIMNEIEHGITLEVAYQHVCNMITKHLQTNEPVELIEPVEDWLEGKRELERLLAEWCMLDYGFYQDFTNEPVLWKFDGPRKRKVEAPVQVKE